jgi:transcriptional regulator with XRE-family HTH domain
LNHFLFNDEGIMAAGDSPTVARRRVRLVLREAREAAGMTQTDVAEAMEWSLSKVIRIESGEVSIAQNDLRFLLSHLGIDDPGRVTELLEDAKIARSRQRRVWWQEPEFREHLTPATRRLIEFEGDVVAIRYFQIYNIPGPLQIPEYAEALTRKWDEELSDEQITTRVEARRMRRQALLDRLHTLHLSVLLDQSVLMRPIGGPEIFAAQVQELIRVSTEGLARIRMVPFDVEAALSNNGGFDLLYLSEDGNDEDAVLYRENGAGDEIVEDSATASRHRARYEKLWHAAMNEDDTIAFFRSRLDTLSTTAGQDFSTDR